MTDKIIWCSEKKEGLSLVEPNNDLASAYIRKAEEALESIRVNFIKDWKISTAYYSVYFSLYALLMKLGIKCGIHSCTIEFAKRFLREYFEEDEFGFIQDSFKLRIDSQYYTDRTVPDEQYLNLIQKAPEFHVNCKSVLAKLNEKKIMEIRNDFQEVINRS